MELGLSRRRCWPEVDKIIPRAMVSSGALDGPFVALFDEDGCNQSGDRAFVRNDVDDMGSALISLTGRQVGVDFARRAASLGNLPRD